MPGEDYRETSLRIWEEMAAGWEGDRQSVWDDSRRVGEWLVDALAPQPGETVMELAAGVGDTGFAAAQRLDAERMDLDDASVDGVLCRWGYMLMADAAAALAETRRVLDDGGRVAFSVWGDPEQNPWASIPSRVLLEHRGAPPPDPYSPGIFAMASEARTRELLAGAGLEPSRMENVEMAWRFDSLDAYWHFVTDLAGAVAMIVRALSEEDQSAVRNEIERRLKPYADGDGYRMPGICLNVLAA